MTEPVAVAADNIELILNQIYKDMPFKTEVGTLYLTIVDKDFCIVRSAPSATEIPQKQNISISGIQYKVYTEIIMVQNQEATNYELARNSSYVERLDGKKHTPSSEKKIYEVSLKLVQDWMNNPENAILLEAIAIQNLIKDADDREASINRQMAEIQNSIGKLKQERSEIEQKQQQLRDRIASAQNSN